MTKEQKLFKFCQDYIAKQKISCAETVSQCDHVIISAYEFIEGVCEIVGYHQYEDEIDTEEVTKTMKTAEETYRDWLTFDQQ